MQTKRTKEEGPSAVWKLDFGLGEGLNDRLQWKRRVGKTGGGGLDPVRKYQDVLCACKHAEEINNAGKVKGRETYLYNSFGALASGAMMIDANEETWKGHKILPLSVFVYVSRGFAWAPWSFLFIARLEERTIPMS